MGLSWDGAVSLCVFVVEAHSHASGWVDGKMSVCLSVFLFCLSVYLPVCLFPRLADCLPLCLTVCLHAHMHVRGIHMYVCVANCSWEFVSSWDRGCPWCLESSQTTHVPGDTAKEWRKERRQVTAMSTVFQMTSALSTAAGHRDCEDVERVSPANLADIITPNTNSVCF